MACFVSMENLNLYHYTTHIDLFRFKEYLKFNYLLKLEMPFSNEQAIVELVGSAKVGNILQLPLVINIESIAISDSTPLPTIPFKFIIF